MTFILSISIGGVISLTQKMAGNKREAKNEIPNLPGKKPRASLLK